MPHAPCVPFLGGRAHAIAPLSRLRQFLAGAHNPLSASVTETFRAAVIEALVLTEPGLRAYADAPDDYSAFVNRPRLQSFAASRAHVCVLE